MNPAWLEAISTLLSAVAAIFSVIVALFVWNGQRRLASQASQLEERLTGRTNALQEKLTADTNALHEKLTNDSNFLNKVIAEKERLLTQRAQLVPIWQYWSTLNHIDPNKPATAQVIKGVNTLELVALCWEAQILDSEIVNRTFRDTFMEIYEEVERCHQPLPGLQKTGRQLLDENRAAVGLYQKWRQERIDEGRMRS